MEKIPLAQYVKQHGQTGTANHVGLTQGAIWQMLQNQRCVDVVINGRLVHLEEIKPLTEPRLIGG